MATFRFLGSGDAFSSGGKFHTCFLFEAEGKKILIDCGASVLSSMKKWKVSPGEIDMILISHLHGDHFGGLPFFLLDARLVAKRTRPLIIAGPPNIASRTAIASEALYPGSWNSNRGFEVIFEELPAYQTRTIDGVQVTPYPVIHPSGSNSYGLRVEAGGKTISYSGDTQWTENLITLSKGADLFICECYKYDEKLPFHLDYLTLKEKKHLFDCSRMILTHLSDQMLERLDEVEIECAEDGLTINL